MRRGLTGYFEPLVGRDAVFVYDEGDRHHEVVVASYLFDAGSGAGVCGSIDELHDWVHARLGAADSLTRRIRRAPLDLDHPVWVPVPDLDLTDHVHLHEVEGGWPVLRDAIAGVAAQRIDLSRPPWELHAFTGAKDIDGLASVTAIVIKAHHAAADGMELRRIEAALFSDGPPPGAPARLTPARGFETTARAVALLPWNLFRFVRKLRSTSSDVAEVERRGADELGAPASDRPHTRFNDLASGRLTFDVTAFDLDEIRAARAVVAGATVNDVLLTIVGGALARLVREGGIPSSESLAALVPISLRLPDSRSGRSREAAVSTASANQLVLGTVRLHTDLVDPAERLAAVTRSAGSEKARWMDPRLGRARSRMEAAPAWLLSLRGWLHRQPPREPGRPRLRNTMVSNLPAPAGEPTLDGAPMRSAFGILPVIDGGRLRHLFSTCGDRVLLSISADPEALPDPASYAADIRAELAHLTTSRT